MEFRAASLVDYVALFPNRSQRYWRYAAVEILAGPAWTLWRDGARVAMCGLWPFCPGVLEAWLMLPSGERKPALATIRYLLMRTAIVFPEKIIIARIDDDNLAGQRMAELAGFVPLEEWLPGTRMRTWLRRSFECSLA